jgi:uncharacterized protein (DUF1697 family)
MRSTVASRVGLLRAINLGSHNKVSMADLRALMTALGLAEPQTLLQSGNVVFRSDASPAELEVQLEQAAATRLGLHTDFFVRSAKEWRALVDNNPFPKEARADPSHLLAVVLRQEVPPRTVEGLQQSIIGREIVRAKGRCLYVVYPEGIGRSRLTSALIEKKLGTRGTARNWNTVLKLDELART